MSPVADTSVWSRFYRSDIPDADAHVVLLRRAIEERTVVTIGVIYLELLRGFTRQTTRDQIHRDFAAVPFVEPTRDDYAQAAELSITCRRAGVQLETVDALIAQLCITHGLALLTADRDFVHAAKHIPLTIWPTAP